MFLFKSWALSANEPNYISTLLNLSQYGCYPLYGSHLSREKCLISEVFTGLCQFCLKFLAPSVPSHIMVKALEVGVADKLTQNVWGRHVWDREMLNPFLHREAF